MDYTFPPNAIVSPECKDLLARILIDNPDKRITVQQILRHPWYQKVRLPACSVMWLHHIRKRCDRSKC